MTCARISLALAFLLLAAAPASATEAESLALTPGAGQVFADTAAAGGKALVIWSNGTAGGTVSSSGAQTILVRARGDQCNGAPRMLVTVDGKSVMSQDVSSSAWTMYGADAVVADGPHTVTVAFTNDYAVAGCDRNLRVDSVTFAAKRGLEAEGMSLAPSNGQVFADAIASGGQGLMIWTNGTASTSYTSTSAATLSVVARGDQCNGAPRMVVSVDGASVLTQDVGSSWTTYGAGSLSSGAHTIAIAFTNDYAASGCDRNLRVDALNVGGVKWYVDPNSNAKRQADAWRLTRPADAAQMDKIANQPQADWFGDWSGAIQSAVSARVSTIAATGATAILVAYNIPKRDCGSYSSGGATSAAAYRTWIRAFAAGIGTRRAIVILEPDALAGMDCLTAADQSTRLSLLSDAVSVLAGYSGVKTYIDAGNSNWRTAGTMASRLKSSGVANASGFSLNVSNYRLTANERSYGDQVSALAGGKHFVIDTSRNGLGPTSDNQWCNPSGRALGPRPTTATGDALADAYLWIKRPGESDGSCNGGPAAGQWWAAYALGLAQRAAYQASP